MTAEYPGAIWAASPNYSSRDSEAVDLIVIHITDGQPKVERSVSRFQKPETKASPHFVIGQAGEVYQLVRLANAAWHDSGRNKRSVGIEHVARTPGELGKDDPGLGLTEAQLDASAALVSWLLRRLGLDLDAVVPHSSNPRSSHRNCGTDEGEGGIWPWQRYREEIAKR